MSPQLIGWLAIAFLLVLLALRVPVAIAMLTAGFVGFWATTDLAAALGVLQIVVYSSLVKSALTVVPLFILMGHFAYYGGFATDIFQTAQKWLGQRPGGVVYATIAGSAAFGAASGSGIAACATVGKVTIPEMLRLGVDTRLSFGSVAAAGTLATMIPPSVLMVIYGIITGQSIAKLLIAGIVPGIVIALIYMGTVYILVRIKPGLCPPGKRYSWPERLKALKGVTGIAILAFIVIGGIYTGWFTPTEAGGVGAFCTLILALAVRRLTWTQFVEGLFQTAKTTAMVYFIVASAFVFGSFLATTRLPTEISEAIVGADVNSYLIILSIVVFYIILGCFFDPLPGMILTLPIIFPAVVRLGFDPIWFGILIVYLCELAMITPPFGLHLFVLKGIFQEVELNDIVLGSLPFVYAAVVILFVLITFPGISTWLPSQMLN
jgi:tripartite ATP-independent transporter DctM subunit